MIFYCNIYVTGTVPSATVRTSFCGTYPDNKIPEVNMSYFLFLWWRFGNYNLYDSFKLSD